MTDDSIIVNLSDGRTVSAPIEWFPRLLDANEAEHESINWRQIDWSKDGSVVATAIQESPDLDLVFEDDEKQEKVVDRYETIAFFPQGRILQERIDQGILFQLRDAIQDFFKDAHRWGLKYFLVVFPCVRQVRLGQWEDECLKVHFGRESSIDSRMVRASLPLAPAAISDSASWSFPYKSIRAICLS